MPQLTPGQARVIDPILSNVAQGYRNLDSILEVAGIDSGSQSRRLASTDRRLVDNCVRRVFAPRTGLANRLLR
mgnify:CR=1 FL=1